MHPELQRIYERLYQWSGPARWWPAETSFEVVVGAILTQNVAWRNVEKAIVNLRAAGLLEPAAMHRASEEDLQPLIRYFRLKSRKLKAFCEFLFSRYGGSLARLPRNTRLLNEYHALIDGLANRLCLKSEPHCGD